MLPYIIGGGVAVVASVISFVLGSSHRKRTAESAIGSAEDEARRILNDAMKNAEAKKKESIEEPLEKQLWKAADKLRKNIDAAES